MGKAVKAVAKAVTSAPKNIGKAIEQVAKKPTSLDSWGNAAIVSATGGTQTAKSLDATFGLKDPKVEAFDAPLAEDNKVEDPYLKEEEENARRKGRASTILGGASDSETGSAKRTLLGI